MIQIVYSNGLQFLESVWEMRIHLSDPWTPCCTISEDAEKQKKKREEEIAAKAAIAESGEALKGRVKKWEYSYGFIEISEPKEHRKAGGIFAHISDFKNREGHTYIRSLFFKVCNDHDHSFMTIVLLDNTPWSTKHNWWFWAVVLGGNSIDFKNVTKILIKILTKIITNLLSKSYNKKSRNLKK